MGPWDAPATRDIDSEIAERELIADALRRLEPSWRALVVLHYFLGVPLPEAAAILGIPLGTAKSRLHRSLSAMRMAIVDDSDPQVGAPARGHAT